MSRRDNEMASMKYDKGDRKAIIQWRDGNRKRRTIRLHKVAKGFAERFTSLVERLDEARRTGSSIDRHVADAVNELADVYYDKLKTVDLVNPRVLPDDVADAHLELNLGQMIDQFIERRVDVKQATQTVYGLARRSLVKFFGEQRAISDTTAGDAEDFARWMAGVRKLAPATIYRRLSVCRLFFADAVKHRLVDENPFSEVRAGERANRDRMRFIPRSDIARFSVRAC